MAATEDAGPLRGPAAGPHLEPLGPGRGQRAEITRDPPATKDAGSSYQATTSSRRVRMWWCSARSVPFLQGVSDTGSVAWAVARADVDSSAATINFVPN